MATHLHVGVADKLGQSWRCAVSHVQLECKSRTILVDEGYNFTDENSVSVPLGCKIIIDNQEACLLPAADSAPNHHAASVVPVHLIHAGICIAFSSSAIHPDTTICVHESKAGLITEDHGVPADSPSVKMRPRPTQTLLPVSPSEYSTHMWSSGPKAELSDPSPHCTWADRSPWYGGGCNSGWQESVPQVGQSNHEIFLGRRNLRAT